MADHPGLVGFRISATNSAGLDWTRLDETWALAAELEAFEAGWMSDHLSDASRERGGPAFEAFTMAAALARRVPGKWVGIAVASATFRHPAVVAKSATVLDNVTGGRFILGIGAGWHTGEHDAYGIPLPPPRQRFDRLESAVGVISALFSPAAAAPEGVTREDRFWPLRGATNQPGPARAGGPPIWLGVGGPRGIGLAARHASGWPMPGNRPGDVAHFAEQRDRLRAALEAAGRDPDGFSFAAQLSAVPTPQGLRSARAEGLAFLRAGATHVIVGLPASAAPDGLRRVATEVAEPLLAAAGA
ncbi:MAG TPA: LLM class flavin-dependent oxidoreductase [Candidatus Limnocylindria bacterium]|nr:LLM class flavin-dependent oxidoreductase [Candidatus Limnocylindria bacterium]